MQTHHAKRVEIIIEAPMETRLTAALENLTDEDYRIHGSGTNEPGFNAVLGVTVKF